MNETIVFAAILMVSIIAVALGYVLAALRNRNQVDVLKQKYADLNSKLDNQRTASTEKFTTVEKMREGLEQTLSSLAPEDDLQAAVSENKEQFIQTLLQPLLESLKSADQQIKRISSEGNKATLLINQQMDILQAPQQLGRGNIKEIAGTLEDAEKRKYWGQHTIKHLLEISYMTDHYRTCATIGQKEEQKEKPERKFPPCLVQVPDGKTIGIDVNTPLEAYVSVYQAPDANVRGWHLETHARQLREHIIEMSSRIYTSQFETKPDTMILMILNDHYLTTALEIDHDLLQIAETQNIILATPTDLLNLLQTIFFAWRQQDFVTDAQQISQTGIHLYKRFGTFIKMIAQLGSELSGVLNSYNRAVSVFEEDKATPRQAPTEVEKPDQEETKKGRKSA
jgi:DNA recombination protein RmuC